MGGVHPIQAGADRLKGTVDQNQDSAQRVVRWDARLHVHVTEHRTLAFVCTAHDEPLYLYRTRQGHPLGLFPQPASGHHGGAGLQTSPAATTAPTSGAGSTPAADGRAASAIPLSARPHRHNSVEQQRELRRRLDEAAGLGRRARDGDPVAAEDVAKRLAGEADPRVRQALSSGEIPVLGRMAWAAPVLPDPAKPAAAGTVRAYWVTPQSHDGTYESTVTVDEQGRAQVETVYEADNGEHWQVRYGGWAFRDAQGRLVVDARGQQVEYIEKPPWGWWSPDSMVIGTNGLIDMIDDKHDPGQGTSGARGPG